MQVSVKKQEWNCIFTKPTTRLWLLFCVSATLPAQVNTDCLSQKVWESKTNTLIIKENLWTNLSGRPDISTANAVLTD